MFTRKTTTISLLAATVGSLVSFTPPSLAIQFDFSVSNLAGNSPNGPLTGVITLPDGNGTFAATSIYVTSAPNLYLPGFQNVQSQDGGGASGNNFAALNHILENQFTVQNGAITAAWFEPNYNYYSTVLYLNDNADSLGATTVQNVGYASNNGINNCPVNCIATVNVGANNSTPNNSGQTQFAPTFTAVNSPQAVPESSTTLGILGLGVLGILGIFKRHK